MRSLRSGGTRPRQRRSGGGGTGRKGTGMQLGPTSSSKMTGLLLRLLDHEYVARSCCSAATPHHIHAAT